MLPGTVPIILFFFLTAFCFSFAAPEPLASTRQDGARLSAEEQELCLGAPSAWGSVSRSTRGKAPCKGFCATFDASGREASVGWSRESLRSSPLSKNDLYRQTRVYRL